MRSKKSAIEQDTPHQNTIFKQRSQKAVFKF